MVTSAEHLTGRGRKGCRRRDFFHVEELQHGRVASGILCWQSTHDCGPGADQKLSDYGVFQPIQIASIIALRECDEDRTKIRATYQKRRDVSWRDYAAPVGQFRHHRARCSCGRSTGAVPYPRVARVLQDTDGESARRGVPGHRFRAAREGYVRLALIENPQRIRQATTAIKHMLRNV